MRYLAVVCLLASAFVVVPFAVYAQPKPRVPTSLPTLNWQCYSSFSVAFAPPGSNFDELGLDGDNLKKPRVELHTINNQILKIIDSPSIPALRKEYAVEMYKMTQDFAKANPVYAWREDSGYEVKIYAFNVNDRILTRTRVGKSPSRALDQNEVFVCK